MLKKMLIQVDIGKTWGTIVQVLQQGSIMITITNLILLAMTAYATTISPYLQDRGIAIPFYAFIIAMVLAVIVSMVVIWRFALPSYFSAFNDQFYKHNNQLVADIQEIKDALGIKNKKEKDG